MCPPHLRVIVGRCLEKQPEARYESTRDLARELEGLREISFALPAVLTRRIVLTGVLALVVMGLVLLRVTAQLIEASTDQYLWATRVMSRLIRLCTRNPLWFLELKHKPAQLTKRIITKSSPEPKTTCRKLRYLRTSGSSS